ncbi:MAG: hypothetical protein PWR24_1554 [Desulfonauticus sp.]|jgi:vacuolar-type H+-ATPase subunit I/STV1|nr:hypothetical protein [Desulfonauticus sp.]
MEEFEIDLEGLEAELSNLDNFLEDTQEDNFLQRESLFKKVCLFLEKGEFSDLNNLIQDLGKLQFEDKKLENFRKVIKNSLVLISIHRNIFELFYFLKNNTDKFLNTKDENILKRMVSFYKKAKQNNTGKAESSELIKTIEEVISSKLHEINIKIEENQRILHRIISKEAEVIEKREEEIEEYFSGKGLYAKVKIDNYYVLDNEYILNQFKINKNKAKKLTKKSFIKLKQLLSPFSSPVKDARGELRKYSAKQAKELNIYPLHISKMCKNPKWALVVDLGEEKMGVIFAEEIDNNLIEGEVERDILRSGSSTFKILNPKEMWQKQQEEWEGF